MSEFGRSMSDLMAQIVKNYPAKPYLYEVRIYGGNNPSTDSTPELMLNCSAVNVPGTNISFTQFKKYGIGSLQNVPTGRSYTELNMTFYETEHEKERKYFSEWQDRIYNKTNKRFGFYSDYVKTISISQFNKSGDKTFECKIFEAFPSNISPLDKSYASGETVPQFNVNMQYFEIEEIYFNKKTGLNPFSLF
jgi:hypothetical protein